MDVWRSPWVWAALVALLVPGCGLGPRTVHRTRLPYNEAVKVTAEEQLLLNVVRLRYSDNPSSLAVSTIAAQFELAQKLALVPFFTSDAGGMSLGGYRGAVLPGAEFNAADRPTLSYTPQDESDFARRLFNPLTLEGAVYLAKTTWPISTVFRLYLENLNWVPNGQTISGPTPKDPPEFEVFLRGMQALQRLQDANKVAILLEERDERVGGAIPGSRMTPRDLVEAAKANHEFKREDDLESGEANAGKSDGSGGEELPPPRKESSNDKPAPKEGDWVLTKKKETPYLYVSPDARSSPDWLEFCRTFRLAPDQKKYEIEVTKLTPFPIEYPKEGVKVIDLETRSLLQVLYFVSHGVEVPPEHVERGLARMTVGSDGSAFDYQRVLNGLFEVKAVKCKKRPDNAAVAVPYLDHWYYVDAADHDSRATFALLVHLSRLEIGAKAGAAPVLTLPLGGR